MKNIRLLIAISALSAMLAAASCGCTNESTDTNKEESGTEENNNENEQSSQEGEETLKPGTFTFIASEMKGKWEVGDEIFVHGSFGLNSEVITLTADNITSDPKVATAELGAVTEYPVDPDGLYATYPASATKQFAGMMKASSTFLNCDGLRCAAYLMSDTFTFADVSSGVSFEAPGYDAFAFCDNNREGLDGMQLKVELTSKKQAFTQDGNSGYPFLEGEIASDGKAMVWLPGEIKFPKGYTIFLSKNGKWNKVYRSGEQISLGVASFQALGDITSQLNDYTGPVPRMPRVTKSTTMEISGFGELSDVCLSATNDFLWGVDDDGYIGKISFDGKMSDYQWVLNDLEDITLNYDTGDILVSMEEGTSYVGVLKAPISYPYKGQKLFGVKDLSGTDNDGMEGLTYYKDGLLFGGAQYHSRLGLIKLDTGELLWYKDLYDKNRVSEIAGLCYDPLTNWLWIIDSESKKVYVHDVTVSQDAQGKWSVALDYLGAYSVSVGSNPEGVCVDHVNHCMWVTDDYSRSASKLYRFDMTGLDDFNIQ